RQEDQVPCLVGGMGGSKWQATPPIATRHEQGGCAAELQEQLQLGRAGLIDIYAEHLAKPWTDFVADFLGTKVSRMPAASQMAYRMCLGALTRTMAPATLGDVTVAVLDEFVSKRLKGGVSAATVNKELRHLRAALRGHNSESTCPMCLTFRG